MPDFNIKISPALPPPTGIRNRSKSGRYVFLSAGKQRGTGSRAGGISITNLLSGKQQTGAPPRVSVPRPRLNIANPIKISRPTVGLNIKTDYGSLNLNLSGLGKGMGRNITGKGVVGAVASAYGLPTTSSGLAKFAGRQLDKALPPLNEALNTLGIPTNIRVVVGNLGLELPKIPEFPGLDMAGLYLGAGPKFIAEQIAKYKTIVPPFIPGLKINMGMALAAMSVIRALMKSNPSDLLKHLLSQIVDDIAGQVMDQVNDAIDKTGINERIGQIKDQVGGVLNGAQIQFEVDFRRNNPPETVYDEDGNATEIQPEMPNSGIPKLDDVIPEKPSVNVDLGSGGISSFSSQNSQQRAYTFPPNG